METYHHVYTLESLSKSDEIYTGQTQDLKQRLREQNPGLPARRAATRQPRATPWGLVHPTIYQP